MKSIVIQKYGGSSVGTLERIERIAAYIHTYLSIHDKKIVIVVSAMGDQTDDLLKMAHQISKNPLRREVDMLLSAGERVTMALLAMALQELKISSISLTGSQTGILTNSDHGNARIKEIRCDRLKSHLEIYQVVIVAGFQGVDPFTKEITTLGRGGSDLTAVALGVALNAQKCELYKDVDGIFSENPHIYPAAKLIEKISWESAYELSAAGAQIIHARAAKLALIFKMPLEIRSTFNSTIQEKLTLIGNHKMEELKVIAVHTEKNQTLFTLTKLDRLDFSRLMKDLDHRVLRVTVSHGTWSIEAFHDSTKVGEWKKNFPALKIERESQTLLNLIGRGFDSESVQLDKIYDHLANFESAYTVLTPSSLRVFVDQETNLSQLLTSLEIFNSAELI